MTKQQLHTVDSKTVKPGWADMTGPNNECKPGNKLLMPSFSQRTRYIETFGWHSSVFFFHWNQNFVMIVAPKNESFLRTPGR